MFPFFKNNNDSRNEKSANGNESKWKFYKDFYFLVGSLTKKKNQFECVEIEKLINF